MKNSISHNNNESEFNKQPCLPPKFPRCSEETRVISRNRQDKTAFGPVHGNFIKWGVK